MESDEVVRVRTLAKRAAVLRPGRAVELRIPPHVAVQVGSPDGGPTHRRGTPPAVVELDGDTFVALATGALTWDEALAAFRVRASGAHADLSSLFTLLSAENAT